MADNNRQGSNGREENSRKNGKLFGGLGPEEAGRRGGKASRGNRSSGNNR